MSRVSFGSIRGGRFKNGFYGLGRPQKSVLGVWYPATYTTRNLEESRKEILVLYKQIMRWIPNMQVDWEIFDVPIDRMKERVGEEFRKNKHVTNHQICDKLRIKAHQAFIEYRMHARYHSHIYNLMRPEDTENKLPKIDPLLYGLPAEPTPFLEAFIGSPDAIDK